MTPHVESVRRYRARLQRQGIREVLIKLPVETIATIDRWRDERGERSRGDVLASLIQAAVEDADELKTP
jgi:metal-responsive CopG/Arc/MetJ family transcriptional regulator